MSQRILIIEDDASSGKMLSSQLTKEGFDVRHVPDAMLGVKATHEFKPDLLILDLLLPAGGGRGVLDRIKLSVKTSRIPVLVLTGLSDGEAQNKYSDHCVEGYVQKPYDFSKFLEEVKRIISREQNA